MMKTGARPVAVVSFSNADERRYPTEEAQKAMLTSAR